MKIKMTSKKGGKSIVMTPKKKGTLELKKKSPSAGPKWKYYAKGKSKSKYA